MCKTDRLCEGLTNQKKSFIGPLILTGKYFFGIDCKADEGSLPQTSSSELSPQSSSLLHRRLAPRHLPLLHGNSSGLQVGITVTGKTKHNFYYHIFSGIDLYWNSLSSNTSLLRCIFHVLSQCKFKVFFLLWGIERNWQHSIYQHNKYKKTFSSVYIIYVLL